MKLLNNDGKTCVFQIGKREKETLFTALALYPVLRAPYRNPAAKGPKPLLDEKLLEEALAEQRKENKKLIQTLLMEESRFESTSVGFKWTLLASQIEWLLQVLNDIRVGSWLALGAPDQHSEAQIKFTELNLRHLWAMEICGLFEHDLLTALQWQTPEKSE